MTDETQNGYSFLAEEEGKKQTSCTTANESHADSVPAAFFAASEKTESSPAADTVSTPVMRTLGEGDAPAGQPDVLEEPVSAVSCEVPLAPSFPPQAAFEARYNNSENIRQKHVGRHGKAFFRRCLRLVGAAALFGTVAAGTFIGFNELYYRLNPSAKPSFRTDSGTDNSAFGQMPISYTVTAQGTSVATSDVSAIVSAAMPSLVSISCTFRNTTSFFGYLYEGTSEGSGSGIIVGKNDKELLIATNNHVVDDAVTTTVTFLDGSHVDAFVRGTEETADLAIVSVPLEDIPPETLSALTTAILGDSDNVKVGQMVIAIGNSLGYGQTTTVGYLSAKERQVTVKDSATGKSVNYMALQVDAAINPGNSGGALLDADGRVIGINSAKLSSTNVEGIGYAIPINNAIDILTELMNREILTEQEQGYLGINLSQQEITDEIARLYGFPRGVFVSNVIEGGAAARAGILSGDIITAVNGSAVTTRTQLQEKVKSYRCGTEVTVTLARLENGEYVERDVAVTLGSIADFE